MLKKPTERNKNIVKVKLRHTGANTNHAKVVISQGKIV